MTAKEQIMATTQTKNGTPPIEAAVEQMKELNEQLLSTARRTGGLYLDGYEKAVDRAIDLELKLADLSRQEWLSNVIKAQTEVARDMTQSYTSAARSLLK
jgi:hypothetical protein